MKKIVWIIPGILLLAACGNNKADQPDDGMDSTVIVKEILLWQSDINDSTGKLEMLRDRPAGLDSLSAEQVIAYLNSNYPNVQLQFAKSSNDTIYVKIPEATYLTQQMGSTGPMMYFATAVYNLTEIPGIRYVNFDFEEGDHAAPDVKTREDFKDQ